MKILTIQQPFASAVATGRKDVENRSWSVQYRQLVAIHAGMTVGSDWEARWPTDEPKPPFPEVLPKGGILAVARLADIHAYSDAKGCHHPADVLGFTRWDGLDFSEHGPGRCSPWGETTPDTFHWALADVIRLTEPIPYTGGLGLRELDPTVEIELRTLLAECLTEAEEVHR